MYSTSGVYLFSTGQAFLPHAISCCFAQWRVGVPRAAGHTHHRVCLLGACIYCVPVYVDDANQVVQFVVPSEGGCLPDASLCTLPITHHAVHTIAVGVHVCACVCCVCVCVCVVCVWYVCVWCGVVCVCCVCMWRNNIQAISRIINMTPRTAAEPECRHCSYSH